MAPFGIDLLTAAAAGDWRSGKWLPFIPSGKTVFPQGVLDPSPEMLAEFHAHFQSGLFGSKPPVNLQHFDPTPQEDPAKSGSCGWIEDTDLRESALWAKISLSTLGEQALTDKRVRYLSAEFAADPITDPQTGKARAIWWRDHRTGERHTNVILGAALCITPRFGSAMVDLLAAAGQIETDDGERTEDTTMTPEQQAQLEADLKAKDEEIERLKGEADGKGKLEERLAAAETARKATEEKLTAVQAEAAATRRRLDREEILKAMAAPIKVGGRDFVIAPALRERAAELALGMEDNEKLFAGADGNEKGRTSREEFLALMGDSAKAVAEVGERGFSGTADEGESATDEINRLVGEALKANDKLTRADAIQAVATSRPELYEAWKTEDGKA